MGYTTKFIGTIKPNRELKASEIAFIEELFESSPREENNNFDFNYIDLEFEDDYSGFKYNGTEKSYDMVGQVQYVIDHAIEKFPDLVFNGEFIAQGEEYDDRWKLIVEDNVAKKVKIVLNGKKITCPHCGENFILE